MGTHIEPTYSGPHQRYARAHIDGAVVPREVDCIVTCSPDTILIRSIYEQGGYQNTVDTVHTIELINIATGHIQWAYTARCAWYTVIGKLLYMHFNIVDSIDANRMDEAPPLPAPINLQDISPQNRRTSHAQAHAANKVSHL